MPYTVYLETFWKWIRLDISYNNPKIFMCLLCSSTLNFTLIFLNKMKLCLQAFIPSG